jgi:hypothetical protein
VACAVAWVAMAIAAKAKAFLNTEFIDVAFQS